ncbi:MAG: ABC transporter permease [Anaerolineales bacterium]|nr:ABC transporter permease [Anaerolineales bacterium]
MTTLGVIIGVASVIVMLAVSAGAEASIAEQGSSALGANRSSSTYARHPRAQPRLCCDAYAIAEQVVGVTGISAEQSPAAQNVRAGGVTLEAIPVIGTTADFHCAITPSPRTLLHNRRR